MSERMYDPILPVTSIHAFESIQCDTFILMSGGKRIKTMSRYFVENWQYRTLKNYIDKRMLWFARRKESM